MAVAGSPEARIRLLGRGDDGSAGPRERILAEAFVLFYTRGIRAVGVDLLVARAGVAKASFYRHFPSKHELVVAYLERRQDAWRAWLRDEVDGRADGRGGLLTIFDGLADLFVDPDYRGDALVNAVAELGVDAPGVADVAAHHRHMLLDFIASLARAARLDRAAHLAEQWAHLIAGAMVAAQQSRDARPAQTARTIATALLDRRDS
jgi:AcrR family transcriptional regulator